MNEKEIIISWNEAVELYKANSTDLSNVREAADKLQALISSNPQQGISKLCYNVSVLCRLLGDKPTDLEYLNKCLGKDPHNALAYYQRATVEFRLDRYIESAQDFQKCTECMRQATLIDYSQLGLRCKLFQHEAIFNEAVCHLQLANRKNCIAALLEVKKLMDNDSSGTLKTVDVKAALESVQNGGMSLEIIERGEGKLYTPPLSKLNNLAKKNYLGKAKVVSSVQSGDTFAGFAGPKLAPPERPSSPRPVSPAPQLSQSKDLVEQLVNSQKNLSLSDRPVTPDYPPPKPASRPSPAPRGAPRGGVEQSTPTSVQNGGGSLWGSGTTPAMAAKPAAVPKPTMCKLELIAGERMETITVTVNTNYIKLMDFVNKALGYEEGTFSLWYLNRQGTYTAIDAQEIVEHVWKWKVKNNEMAIYVFGV